MEPVVELSVRVASLFGFVRDYCPDACWVKDAVALGSVRIKDAAARDYAVLRTLQEFVESEELNKGPGGIRRLLFRPKQSGESDPLSEALERPCTVRELAELSMPVPQTDEQKRAALAELFARKLQQCLGQIVGLLPDTLLCKELRSVPNGTSAATRLRWVHVTREEIAEQTANAMLADETLVPKIAEALGYTPQLIRELAEPTRKKCLDLLKQTRGELCDLCCDPEVEIPVPFSFVLSDELDEIRWSRRERLRGMTNKVLKLPEEKKQLPREQAYQDCLFGMALSGGGIRSATFALGVLQGMADRNMLPFIDYLSTVSGGGYIGSWLIAWTKRRGSIQAVQETLRGSATNWPSSSSDEEKTKSTAAAPPNLNQNSDPRAEHARPIRLLREYARYLAPQAGLFSADSWTLVSTWLRNTVLSLTVLMLALASLLLLPRSAAYVLVMLPQWLPSMPRGGAWPVLLAGPPLWAACVIIGFFNLRPFRYWRNPSGSRGGRGDSEDVVTGSVLLLVVAGAFYLLAALWSFRGCEHPWWAALGAGVVFLVGIILIALCSSRGTSRKRILKQGRYTFIAQMACAPFCAAVGGLLICALCKLFLLDLTVDAQYGAWIVLAVGLCLILFIISAVVTVMIGLLGNTLSDEQREWWSRLGAWVCITVAAWLLVCAICFFSPLWIAQAWLSAVAAGLSWITITTTGVKAAFSASSGRNGEDNEQNPWVKAAMWAAPMVFTIGLLMAVSFGLYYGLGRAMEWEWLAARFLHDPVAHLLCCTNSAFNAQKLVDNYWALMYPASAFPLSASALLLAVAMLLNWRVDINEFSMHHFYKNRLVRCYLGASRPRERRWPNAFTDFDMEDDIRLCRFRGHDKTRMEDAWTNCKSSYIGPYPIINTALNVTRSSNLAHQERKAESFTFTPLWSGFDFVRKQTAVPLQSRSEYAFRPTKDFAFEKRGIFLGTAMAISGAAASSNAGFHTSPSLAFLLTVFNVRLGWWIGNPAHKTWKRSGPALSLFCLGRELTAQTSTEAKYLLLSDGGHFENMALYELVRRRCRYIVVSDAEEDAKFKLEGIGGAIRKCRVDFGVVIDLDLEALQPLGDPSKSRLHYSIGTILYPEHLPAGEGKNKADKNPCGVLVYIKSSITGDEPVDVAEFRKRQPHFPHDSTANQFFDESHFESYRALGHHSAQGIFSVDAKEVLDKKDGDLAAALESVFEKIQDTYCDRLEQSKAKESEKRG